MNLGRRSSVALVVTVLALLFGALSPVSADTPRRSVSVSVLNVATDAPIDGVNVTLFLYEGNHTWSTVGPPIAPTADGTATFDIEPGTYTLYFEDPQGRYQPGWGTGLPNLPQEGDPGLFSFDTDASPLVLPDVHLRPLGPATAVIRGHVLDEHGRGVDGFDVVAYPGWPYYTGDDGNEQASAITHASADGSRHGYFELSVPAGEYDLLVSGTLNGEYGPDWQGPTIVVADGDDFDYGDIYMRPHNAGFTGKVRGADGRGIDDILVQAWLVGGSDEPVASALTYASRRGAGHGYYELFLPDNYGRYLVRFSDPDGRYLARDYRDGREVVARSRVWKELLPTTMVGTDVSGVVTDQFGRAIAGADVALRHDGSPVADGDTGFDGSFRWSVSAGSYEVSVTSASSHGATCFVASTGALVVPPSRSDLLLKTICPGAAAPLPAVAPQLSGTAQVGQTLSATSGAWDASLSYLQTQWLRDGVVVGTGSSYTLTAADAGKKVTARVSAGRPDYVQENGAGSTVSFTPATYDLVSATVTTPRPVATTTTAELADDKVDTSGPATVKVAVVRADRQPVTGTVEVYVDGVRVRTAALAVADGGRLSVVLPVLDEGKYDVRVAFVGSTGVLGSQAATLTLKVKKAKKAHG